MASHLPDSPLQRAAHRSLLVSVAVNVVLTIMQLLTGLWAGSQALVADALHSLSDLIADFVALLARKHSHKAPDADRAFLTKGGVFSDAMLDAYIELKMQEVTRFRMAVHPVEYDMYYSL